MKEFKREKQQMTEMIEGLSESEMSLKAENQSYLRQVRDLQFFLGELEKEVESLKGSLRQSEWKYEKEYEESLSLRKKYEVMQRVVSLERIQGDEQRGTVLAIEKERLLIEIQTLKKIGSKKEDSLRVQNERNKQL